MHNQEFPITVSINVNHHIYDLAPAIERLGHEVFDAVYQVVSSDNDPTVTLSSVYVDYEQDDPSVTVNYVINYRTTTDNNTGTRNQIINQVNEIEGVLSAFSVKPKNAGNMNVIPAWLSDYELA
jgi:hypothetical protein